MPTHMKYTIFNRRTELLRVPLAKAMFYEAYGNYCYGVFPNKQKVMLPVGLTTVEEMLHSRLPKRHQPSCALANATLSMPT